MGVRNITFLNNLFFFRQITKNCNKPMTMLEFICRKAQNCNYPLKGKLLYVKFWNIDW